MKGIVNPEDDAVAHAPFGDFRPGFFAKLSWSLATAKYFSRPVRKRFRKRFARNHSGPFDVTAENIRMRAWPAENRCDRVAVGRNQLPEAEERRLLAPLLKPDMVFVDIGANVGVYTLFVSHRTAATARVVALEPHPRTFAKLECNCWLNGFLGNVSAINAAAGEVEEVSVLFSDGGGNIGGASMLREAGGGAKSVEIKMRPLPDILKEQSVRRIDLLKIDVEGFEDRALMPLLANFELEPLWPKAILIETVHQTLWHDDLLAVFEARGYYRSGATSENLLFER